MVVMHWLVNPFALQTGRIYCSMKCHYDTDGVEALSHIKIIAVGLARVWGGRGGGFLEDSVVVKVVCCQSCQLSHPRLATSWWQKLFTYFLFSTHLKTFCTAPSLNVRLAWRRTSQYPSNSLHPHPNPSSVHPNIRLQVRVPVEIFLFLLDHKWLMSLVAMVTMDNEICSFVVDCGVLGCDAV